MTYPAQRYSAKLTSTSVLLLTLLLGVGGNRRASAEAVVSERAVVRPRFGLELDSAGGGAEPFAQVESFIPLWQNVGSDVIFFQGQLSADIDDNLGTNLQLGYRHFSDSDDRIYGGYFAFDRRGVDTGSFNQLGFGLETLGEDWDLRFNGYVPLGDRSVLIGSDTADAGIQRTDPAFVGNQLTTALTPQQADLSQFDVAMGGFDVEVGKKLLNIGNHGALRGVGGLYYYDGGEDMNGSFGWRVRLEAEPTRYLRTGISVQNDDFFGTHFRFNLGALFPNRRNVRSSAAAESRQPEDKASKVHARLGESLARDGHIMVDRRTDVSIEAVAIEEDAITRGPVINPATGEPWFFNHVVEAFAEGDGSAEAPFEEIQAALDSIPTDGNGIVYVTADESATFSNNREESNDRRAVIDIPVGVRLLSSGPEQFIEAFDNNSYVQLPNSGSGEFPSIAGGVRLSGSLEGLTEIAGFAIENDSYESGISAFAGQGDIAIRDNLVSSSSAGIIVNSGGRNHITISGNTIEASGVGIAVYNNSSQDLYNPSTDQDSSASESPGSSITITGNTSIEVGTNSSRDDLGPVAAGIMVTNTPGSRIENAIEISDNGPIVVTSTGNNIEENNAEDNASNAGGVVVLNGGVIEGGVIIADNESISLTAPDTEARSGGLSVTAGVVVNNYSSAGAGIEGGITISGNTITDSSEYGIVVGNGGLVLEDIAVVLPINGEMNELSDFSNRVVGDLTITGNTVTANDDSILVFNTDRIIGSVTFESNTLNSGIDDGIDVSNLSVNSLIEGDLVFLNNDITAAGDDVKCTNNGSITGTNSSPSTCRTSLEQLP